MSSGPRDGLFEGRGEREPEEPGVIAELVYEFGKSKWRAFVQKGVSPDGEPAFNLYIQVSDQEPMPAGSFTHGAALIKYVQEDAIHNKRLQGFKPVKDTLQNLANLSPASLAPLCYRRITDKALADGLVGEGRGLAECPTCPYQARCGSVVGGMLTGPAESDEDFQARLAQKLKLIRKDE